MNVLTALRSEVLKTKRTSALYVTIIAAAFGPFMSMLDLAFDGITAEDGPVILEKMFTTRFQMTGFVILPVFLILICTLLPQIEYKNNTWKQVLCCPQPKGNIFIAKAINIQLLILLFFAVNQLLMLADAVILHFTRPALHILAQPVSIRKVMTTLGNSYAALLALYAIQFWLGLRYRNFIIPVAIGMACWFTGSILVMQLESPFAAYFPYSFHAYTSFPKYKARTDAIGWTSLGYAVLFLITGFLDFRKRRLRT